MGSSRSVEAMQVNYKTVETIEVRRMPRPGGVI